MASRQETSVQNSTPSHNPVSSPSLLQTLLEHTFLGAWPASPGAAPTGGDLPGADPAPSADAAVGDVDPDATDTADADAVGRLELAELLGVLRDPIEWVFTLAERRAQGDPIDIAAAHRVRDAVLHRVNAVIIGAPHAESPRMRSADLWTVAELLIDALDPSLVARVLRGVGTSLTDALAAGLPFAPSLVADPGEAAAPIPGPHVPTQVPPSWYLGTIPTHAVAPFGYGAAFPHLPGLCGGACGGLCPGSRAAAHALRSIVPPWCWSHSPVSF
jgi:hypothetical protein